MAHSKRTRVLRSFTVVAIVIITVGMPLLAPTTHRIDSPHFRLIRLGMDESEVETIFRVPAGQQYPVELSKGLACRIGDSSKNMISSGLPLVATEGIDFKHWTSRSGSFNVGFKDGRVVCLVGWENTIWETWRHSWHRLFP